MSNTRALHPDLRIRIVEAYERGEGTEVELAARFDVSLSSVQRFRRLHRELGSVAPRPHGGGHEDLIADDALPALRDLVEANRDATQTELAFLWQEATGSPVSRATIGRALARAGITQKKDVPRRGA